jgi:beta-galactosidase
VIYSFDEMKGGLMGSWPWLSCYQGDLDLIGDARPQNMYRRVMWGVDKGIHMYTTHPERTGKPFYGMGWHWEDIVATWTFDDEYIGQPVKVQAYADCDEVEFVLNGANMGREVPVEYKVFKELPYEPGYIEVRAIKAGEIVATDRIETVGTPAAIKLRAEREVIAADGMDLAYVHADIVDAQGRRVTGCDMQLTASVSGAGTFLAFGSGNPCTEENYTDSRITFRGTAMVCARAAKEAGELTIKITAENLPEAEITLKVE